MYKYERLYRNLYNPEFYLLAYKNIYTNDGSMTPGVDGVTTDGMSLERIDKIIASLKDHSYRPNPARRTYIAKKNNPAKKRPLGIPSGDDKLVQEVVRMILESIYEPTFSNVSHGFRPVDSALEKAATPRWSKFRTRSLAQSGLWRAISKRVSTALTTMY